MILFIPVGRLASEPSLRETAGGHTCCSFSYAVDTGVKDANGQKITNFFNVTAWGKLAEVVEKRLNKGDAVSITGSFCSRAYQGTDGKQRNSLDINASSIDFLPGGKKEDGQKKDDSASSPPRRRRQQQQVEAEATSNDPDEMPF